MDRRSFIQKGVAGIVMANFSTTLFASCSGARPKGLGITDWNLGGPADPSLIPLVEKVGLQALQVSVGPNPNSIPLRDEQVRKQYIELGKRHNITFCSVAAGGILNSNPLATEPQSAVFVIDALEAAKALGSKNILAAFFGSGNLLESDENGDRINISTGEIPEYRWKEKDVERVIAVMKQIVPRAEDLGVVIGLENTLSARQNLQIIEEIGSSYVQVYYDLANPWGLGYDVPGEIRLLGNHRICEVHIKDVGTQLFFDGTGKVDFKQCAEALDDIGYDKWYVMETSGRRDKFEEDTKANIEVVRKIFF